LTEAPNTPLRWDTPLTILPGVGPKRAAALANLGLTTAGDLLDYIPRDYLQYAPEAAVTELKSDTIGTVRGTIIQTRLVRRRPLRFEALLDDGTQRCVLTWFNMHGMDKKLYPGVRVLVTGKVGQYDGRVQFVNPRFELQPEGVDAPTVTSARIEPVYPANSEISSHFIAMLIQRHLSVLVPLVQEWYPEAYLAPRGMLSRQQAYSLIHQPQEVLQVTKAKRTLAYHDFMTQQLVVALRRHGIQTGPSAQRLRIDDLVDQRIRRLVPFTLTQAQERVIQEIRHDISGRIPMNRLIQGDVGSGKTVVALYAMLCAVATKMQTALMAPTEILAEQHYLSIQRYLANSKVRMVLVTGSLSAAEREKALADIANGKVDLIIGTHALITESNNFSNLGLVVVDEQHKFGVNQRADLRLRHGHPHTLVMTATPIPRTLAMTVYGDLDLSVIDELPPGRQPIHTRKAIPANRPEVYEFVRSLLVQGAQAYVVVPAVDENADDLAHAVGVHKEFQQDIFKEYRIGVVHGRMNRAERQAVMEQFRRGELAVLVATTVIEVGVDVPNAVIMVIEHAERFGLAQLHQLRGRVGRGQAKSYCILIADTTTEDARQRIEAMIEFKSGFDIAQKDLEIRGMGHLIGTEQSGASDIRFADLLGDTRLLNLAQRDARAIITEDPQLLAPNHTLLHQHIRRLYGATISLADVG